MCCVLLLSIINQLNKLIDFTLALDYTIYTLSDQHGCMHGIEEFKLLIKT